MATGTLTADAAIGPRYFTADAWILRERPRHHRVRDHYGPESDLFVVLSSDVGPYPAGTPLHYVMVDFLERILLLENGERTRASFVADAWLAVSGTYGRGVVWGDAVIFDTGSSTFTLDAFICGGASFTADAVILSAFRADAYIV